MLRSVVLGCGSYLPEPASLTNAELAKTVDTSDEWIVQRTGIRQRHLAAEGEFTSDLAVNAARAALENAGLTIADIDLVVVATTTPDLTYPATAALVQEKLGMHHGVAFDIQAVCSGLRLRRRHRRQLSQERPGQARARNRGRDQFAYPRLDRPRHLRAVRRRRRCGDHGGLSWRMARPTADCSQPRCVPMAIIGKSSTSMAGLRPQGRLGMCRWKGREVVQACRRDDHRRNRGCLFRPRPGLPLRTSTGSCRIRPISGLSTGRAINSAFRLKRSCRPSTGQANTSAASVPLALAAAGHGRAHQKRRSGDAGGDGRRLHLGRRCLIRW